MRQLTALILKTFSALAIIFAISANHAGACSNVLVTKGASKDGSVMVTYSADSHVLYGELFPSSESSFGNN